ncbi:GNAT family N-acetyltransferase [Parachlamydia acanthamoebae]|uniref:GNAT family N-acetyltransferase n=1 Tax=Parachlamydia acanthamoebae TaxID=83552 RepID=UPI003F740A93
MELLLDLADNWLKLVRVELDVFSDNQKAISLYQSCGFEIEGKKSMLQFKMGSIAICCLWRVITSLTCCNTLDFDE